MFRSRTLNSALVASGLLLVGLAVMADTAAAAPTGAIECGATVTVNTTLKNDVGPCSGDGLQVTGSNITLNLNGHQVFATNGIGAGIRLLDVTGVTVKGGTVEGFAAGVVVDGGSGNTVKHVTVQSNGEGIRIVGSGSGGHLVEKNTATGNRLAGIALRGAVLNTTVKKNTSSDNHFYGIFVSAESANNVFDTNVVDYNGVFGIFLSGPTFGFTNVGPTLLDLVSPDRAPYVEGTDYRVMSGSGSGDVTARLVAIDIALNPAATALNNPNPLNTSTSGCHQADYDAAGFQPGDVALIQRGTCTFVSKVGLAVANGASAVVIFNEGQAPLNRTTFAFGAVFPVPIPVLSTTYAVGFELYNLTRAGPVTLHVVTNTTNVGLVGPGANNNTLTKNTGLGHINDGFDGNFACDNNRWIANVFETVNQSCVDADASVVVGGPPQELGALSE